MSYLVVGVFIALFLAAAARALYLRWRGVVTTAVVVAIACNPDSEGDTYSPVVAFSTRDGERIEAKSMYGTPEARTYFRVGEQVTVRYLAHKPTCFAIAGYEGSMVLWFFLFAAGAVAIFWYSTGK